MTSLTIPPEIDQKEHFDLSELSGQERMVLIANIMQKIAENDDR